MIGKPEDVTYTSKCCKTKINLSKSEFACATMTFLGHVVGQGHIKPVDSKVCAFNDFPRPENKNN